MQWQKNNDAVNNNNKYNHDISYDNDNTKRLNKIILLDVVVCGGSTSSSTKLKVVQSNLPTTVK